MRSVFSFVMSSTSLRNNWSFLNFVCVFCELIPEHTRQISVMENDHIGVVFLVIVVLPTFVPPTKTDDAWPSIREQIFERGFRPACRLHTPVV
jgi:hypothetical protein